MNKKGAIATEKTISYILFGFFCSIIFIAFVYLVTNVGGGVADIPLDLRDYVLVQRFLNNEDCFTYSELGRVYSGVIDADKFTDDNLQKCFDSENIVFGLRLKGEGLNAMPDNWEDGKPSEKMKDIDVLVYKDGKMVQDKLILLIQRKR